MWRGGNGSKSSSCICTHYCLHYLQIQVLGERHNIGMLGHIETYYGWTMKLQKRAIYTSTHYYSLIVLKIPTHSYKHCMMMRIFEKTKINYLNIHTTWSPWYRQQKLFWTIPKWHHNLMNICNWHVCNASCCQTNATTLKSYASMASFNL